MNPIENPKFRVEDLNLYYGDFKALNKINMNIPKMKLLPL